jgi:hypothetical protein
MVIILPIASPQVRRQILQRRHFAQIGRSIAVILSPQVRAKDLVDHISGALRMGVAITRAHDRIMDARPVRFGRQSASLRHSTAEDARLQSHIEKGGQILDGPGGSPVSLERIFNSGGAN